MLERGEITPPSSATREDIGCSMGKRFGSPYEIPSILNIEEYF